jgi:hypothetical protein
MADKDMPIWEYVNGQSTAQDALPRMADSG